MTSKLDEKYTKTQPGYCKILFDTCTVTTEWKNTNRVACRIVLTVGGHATLVRRQSPTDHVTLFWQWPVRLLLEKSSLVELPLTESEVNQWLDQQKGNRAIWQTATTYDNYRGWTGGASAGHTCDNPLRCTRSLKDKSKVGGDFWHHFR